MSEFKRPRRYYLLKRLDARAAGDWALEEAWQSKQQGEPGSALPTGFPSKSELEAVGYATVEDVDGADCCELQNNAHLSSSQANAALAAIAAL